MERRTSINGWWLVAAIWTAALVLLLLTGCRRRTVQRETDHLTETTTHATVERTDLRALTARTEADTVWSHTDQFVEVTDMITVTLSEKGDTLAVERRRTVDRTTDRDRGRAKARTAADALQASAVRADTTVTATNRKTIKEKETPTISSTSTKWSTLLRILGALVAVAIPWLYLHRKSLRNR